MNSSISLGFALRRNVSLASYTTIKIGGAASYFAEPTNEQEIVKLLEWARKENLPFMILGNGSNVVFDDEGYSGLVIGMRRFKNDHIQIDHERPSIRVAAGVTLSHLAKACLEAGLSGTEFLAHIPGTLGGALIMNAGFSRHAGQRNAIGDLVQEVTALRQDGSKVVLERADLKFGYRQSNLHEYLILDAELILWKRPKEYIRQEVKANGDFRKMRQDVHEPNAGSVFKNPEAPHPAAAALIDQLGLKGKQIGQIQISEVHANYFVNKGAATCADLRQMIKEVQKTVFDATGIKLEPEIHIISKN